MKKSRDARFWEKIEGSPSGCLIWKGTKSHGYGYFWDGTKEIRAHRYSYEMAHGPIPDGLIIDHLCRVRDCVNPAHLEVVNNRENIWRGRESRGLPRGSDTHCPLGHEFTEENSYIWRRARKCKTCMNGRTAARRRARREMGLCGLCGGIPLKGYTQCEKCLQESRRRKGVLRMQAE